MIPGVSSTSAIAALAVTVLAVTVPAAATTTSAPTTTAPPTTTTPPVPARFVAPDGTFAITLPGVPAATADADAGSDAFTIGVGEDLVAVTRYPLDAFDGDTAATTGCSTPRAPWSRNWPGSTRRCGRTRRRTSSTNWPSTPARRPRCTAW